MAIKENKYNAHLNSGTFRSRIDIYGNKKYENELGEENFKFDKIKSIWAAIIPQTAKLQSQQAETILTNVTHKIIVRYSAVKSIVGEDINQLKDMEIRYKNHRFKVKYTLNPYFNNETLEIFVEEVLS